RRVRRGQDDVCRLGLRDHAAHHRGRHDRGKHGRGRPVARAGQEHDDRGDGLRAHHAGQGPGAVHVRDPRTAPVLVHVGRPDPGRDRRRRPRGHPTAGGLVPRRGLLRGLGPAVRDRDQRLPRAVPAPQPGRLRSAGDQPRCAGHPVRRAEPGVHQGHARDAGGARDVDADGRPVLTAGVRGDGSPRLNRYYTTSSAFLEALAEAGVSYVFANLGSDHPGIIEALAQARAEGRDSRLPTLITCPHETVALSAAHAYAAVTRRPQPVLVFAGAAPYTMQGELPGGRNEFIHWVQDVHDQRGILRGYVKYDNEIRTGRNVKQLVHRAFQTARSAPGGPVYLAAPRGAREEPVEPNDAHPKLYPP